MKDLAKKLVVYILTKQVDELQKRHPFKTIAIAGSIGKTSTKFAIASLLKRKYRVRYQEGNYNDLVSVPLVYFGHEMPNLISPFGWLKIFIRNYRLIRSDFPYDIVIVELGTDGPGQIEKFNAYVKSDLSILTAIAPEHMEFFLDLDDVAKEEMSIAKFSQQILVNQDLCDDKYISQLTGSVIRYSTRETSDFQLKNLKYKPDGYEFDIFFNGNLMLRASHEVIAESQLFSLCAATAVCKLMGMRDDEIKYGLGMIQPVNGRMKRLNGINNSTIIDDTYNASPEAVKAALDTIYRLDSPQKIAVLGNMNELGKYSESAHTSVGEHCDPTKLSIVLTLGPDANKFLAPAAAKNGCKVKCFNNPYEVGDFLKTIIEPNAVILAKGSQNGVFAEEAIKMILANPGDEINLVRQSDKWLKIKQKQFGK